jgi:hypothetical protein
MIVFWRVIGMNIARALGDKFLKQEDSRFSSTPFVSEVLEINQESRAVAIMARYFVAILLNILLVSHNIFNPYHMFTSFIQ